MFDEAEIWTGSIDGEGDCVGRSIVSTLRAEPVVTIKEVADVGDCATPLEVGIGCPYWVV